MFSSSVLLMVLLISSSKNNEHGLVSLICESFHWDMNIGIDISMGYHNEYLNVIIHMCKSSNHGKVAMFRQLRKSA